MSGGRKLQHCSSRGYCGWYNGFYYRSFVEFVYIKLLERYNISFTMESVLFDTPYGKYKPDFIIHTLMIETKSDNYKLECDNKLQWLISHNKIILLYYKDIVKFFTREEVNSFKKFVKSNVTDSMRSTLNPRFGVLASEETKRKIGDSTRLRFKTPEFKEKHKAGMLRFFSTESGVALKHKLSVLRKSKPKKPKAVTMCKVCGILHNTGGITCKSSVCLRVVYNTQSRRREQRLRNENLDFLWCLFLNMNKLQEYSWYRRDRCKVKLVDLFNDIGYGGDVRDVKFFLNVRTTMCILDFIFLIKGEMDAYYQEYQAK